MTKDEIKERVLDALTGGSVECAGVITAHEENLTRKGARDILDILKLADFAVVPVEQVKP